MAFKYATEPRFKRRLRKKTAAQQEAVLACIELVIANPFPGGGLKTKLLQAAGPERVYYARIDRASRLTFHFDGEVIVFRNHCEHDEVLRRP